MDQAEIKSAAAEFLRKVESGNDLGTELFDAVALLSISLPFEAAALRRGSDGELYIYLRQRKETDTAYPREWHIPEQQRFFI